MITRTLLRQPVFKAGMVCQAIAFLLIVGLVVATKAGWVELPTAPADGSPPKAVLTPLDTVFLAAFAVFVVGLTLQVVAVVRLPRRS